VDDEKGVKWNLNVEANRVNGSVIPLFRGGLDFGLPVGPAHSTVWLRNAAGIADGDRNDLFANFFFGGFGNNYVDHKEVKRYREYQAFPGVDIDAIGGRSFGKSTLEWNLPPIVFERAGTPGFYLTWARPALFVGVLAANPGAASDTRTVENVGGQLDFKFTAMHRLDMTLSFGAAAAFEKGRYERDEFMVSLKVL